MCVYCLPCYHVIAAPYIRIIVMCLQTMTLLITNAQCTMHSLYSLNYFPDTTPASKRFGTQYVDIHIYHSAETSMEQVTNLTGNETPNEPIAMIYFIPRHYKINEDYLKT